MSLCESIDTLSMAYLDDELAPEERRELELHLVECAGCRVHVDGERMDKSMLRKALVAPPAPDLLKAKIARMLDQEERSESREQRKRWRQWALPGSAILAAAAAIAVFIGVKPQQQGASAVVVEATRQQSRPMPLEVKGTETTQWVRANLPSVEPPAFSEPGIAERGARLISVNGHDGAMIQYDVNTGRFQFILTALVLEEVHDGELDGGDAVKVGERTLHLTEIGNRAWVTYVDANHRGYMFYAPVLTPNELIQLVVHSNLLGNR